MGGFEVRLWLWAARRCCSSGPRTVASFGGSHSLKHFKENIQRIYLIWFYEWICFKMPLPFLNPRGKFLQSLSVFYRQAGLTLKALPWENREITADEYIEQFYEEGREEELVEPSHFQGLFLLMGLMISAGLGKSSWEKRLQRRFTYLYLSFRF